MASSFLGAPLEFKPGHKLFGSPRLKVRLGLLSAAVLVLGSLLAPRAAQQVLAVPDDRAAVLLEQRIGRDTGDVFRGLQSTVDVAARYGVAMPLAEDPRPTAYRDYSLPTSDVVRPAGFGVVVSAAGDVLTHDTALDGRLTTRVQTSGGAFEEAQIAAYEKTTGLTLLRIPAEPGLEVPEFASRAEAGAVVAAVGRFDGRVIARPAFVSSVGPDAYTITAADESVSPGTPVFDADGRLLAIAAGGDDRSERAFPAREALARLTARAAAGRGHEASIGVAFQLLDEPLVSAFGTRGALVSEIVDGGPAQAAGLEPGDVLVAVNGMPVDSPNSALAALATLARGSQAVLQMVRGGRPEDRAVVPSSAFEVAARARAAVPDDMTVLPEAGALWTATRLQRASVPPGARVLGIDGRAVTSIAQARRELTRGRAQVVVYLHHGGRRFFASIEGRP